MSRMTTISILGFLTAWILTVEVLRYTIPAFREFLLNHIQGIMRAHEHKKLFGSTWYLIGCFWTLVLFPPIIAITAILFLNVGDLAAALVGMSYGETKLLIISNIFGGPPTKKSLEGSLACFVTCMVVGMGVFFGGVPMFEYIVFMGALGATLGELIPGIDDNVTIPLVSGTAMTFAVWRLGVELPAYLNL
jgi:dolichol kinase